MAGVVVSVKRDLSGHVMRIVCRDGPCEVVFGPDGKVIASYNWFHDTPGPGRIIVLMTSMVMAIVREGRKRAIGDMQLNLPGFEVKHTGGI
jgi:hypothetical protein